MFISMVFRIAVILIGLWILDLWVLDGKYTQMTIQTAQGFGNDFNYRVARFFGRCHSQKKPRRAGGAVRGFEFGASRRTGLLSSIRKPNVAEFG